MEDHHVHILENNGIVEVCMLYNNELLEITNLDLKLNIYFLSISSNEQILKQAYISDALQYLGILSNIQDHYCMLF